MSAELKSELVERAREVGFDVCRISQAKAPKSLEKFERWIAAGAHGEMQYLERGAAKRSNLSSILPDVRSMVSLAMNYWQGEDANQFPGRIARYAWGDDYHALIEKKLEALDGFLIARGGIQKCYVDTGPILERDYAARAGVGWHGKSTMLINRELGTWFFLAEILTTLDLPADEEAHDHCGSCRRCIDACPTGAITAPRELDARRCISYLTIELKGSIPEELRPLIGDRIYGCDACLDACPWNRFAKASREATFAASPATRLPLRDYLALDEAQFRALFRNSPIKRTKRRGFLRNVCVALGNVGTPADLPALQRATLDSEPLIVEHARWAIARIESKRAAGTVELRAV